MSLSLNLGTKPAGLQVKTWGSKTVYLGDYEISMKDFLSAAEYVLTNTDLEPKDPRLQFVKCVKSIKKVKGYKLGQKRLEASEPPILPKRS